MEPTIQIALATGVGAGIGALVANVFSLINGWHERRSQNRRALRQAAFTAGVEYWKANKDIALSERTRMQMHVPIYPLDTYVIPLLALADQIADDAVTSRNVDELFAEFHRVNSTCIEAARKYSEE